MSEHYDAIVIGAGQAGPAFAARLDVMYAKKPYATIRRAVHIRPTVAELVLTLPGTLRPLQP